ncbi:sugar transferase [Microbacterium sp. LRZ72]|uniref:sugar transferase n=1 Tax=Microbacterium sp. LRZ72 TaxID=2942481 RepID=UPI0029A56D32|nr:sugar transferase [Microbacterium sp. LRZ72]MDX2377453.1 sugar transferase [Microbacterium sp. LRZ72]
MTSVEDAVTTVTDPPLTGFRPIAAPRAAQENLQTIVTPRVQPGLEQRRLWERRYLRRLRITDAAVVILAVACAAVVPVLVWSPGLLAADPWFLARVPLLSAAAWLAILGLTHTRAPSVMGSGATEYKRVVHATGLAFGLLAIAFLIFQWEGLRTQLVFAMPLGLFALLGTRWLWRRWLVTQRRYGHYASRAIVIGSRRDVADVIDRLQKDAVLGYIVVGVATDDDAAPLMVDGRAYETVATVSTATAVAQELGADTIIVASLPGNDPGYVKRLSWELEGTAAELVLASGLTDIAGPRLSFRPVDGLPLIHVTIPSYEGGQHLLKRALDILVAGLALLVMLPLLPLIALAIRVDSRGPVFFRQTRVGRDGREFSMLKFRSMRETRPGELEALRAQSEAAGPLFKMRDDPRVTRIGRFLRAHSIDELPQFWNVLIGDMSIVGPRPPLPIEVTDYDGTVFRRLYIKPGITGPWQVSGRSDLSWEDSVRLDLRYVENWSVMNDLMLMWRTGKVMIQPKGAY